MNRIETVLARISFAPSCIDMGWKWEVVDVVELGPPIEPTRSPIAGHLIRCSFRRPDTNTGEVGTGFGRWWFVEDGATDSSIIKTAWLAIQTNIDHERFEGFLVDGVKVFDPHVDIEALIRANAKCSAPMTRCANCHREISTCTDYCKPAAVSPRCRVHEDLRDIGGRTVQPGLVVTDFATPVWVCSYSCRESWLASNRPF